jgi:hypothetical protein
VSLSRLGLLAAASVWLACSRASQRRGSPDEVPAIDAVVAEAGPGEVDADGPALEAHDSVAVAEDAVVPESGQVDDGEARDAASRVRPTADLDPSNDGLGGPPDPIPECEAALLAAGVDHGPASLPVTRRRNGDVCGVEQAVSYRSGPTGIRWSPRPVVSCGMALALARFERVAQEEAERRLGSRIVRAEQGGTTSCRRIGRFPGLMSEHSFANGIDVRSFLLEDGRTISVQEHFGAVGEEPTRPEGLFLRELAHRLYDEDVFSVVLTAFWDDLHRDHFHLDLARYRVDGTR